MLGLQISFRGRRLQSWIDLLDLYNLPGRSTRSKKNKKNWNFTFFQKWTKFIKNAKNLPIWRYLKNILRANSVTRQVIGGKCRNWKIQMRHFGWFSNNVKLFANSDSKGVLINATYIVKFYESIRLFWHIPLHFHVIHVTNIIEFALSHNIGRWSTFAIFSDPFDNLWWLPAFQSEPITCKYMKSVFCRRFQIRE